MKIIDTIAASVESQRPNAFYLHSSNQGTANLLIEGRQHPGVVCFACIRTGHTLIFNSSTNSADAQKEFTLIAAKSQRGNTDVVLFDSDGKILLSSEDPTAEDITGYFWIGFSIGDETYAILLTINIASSGSNFSQIVVAGDESHCNATMALALFAYHGGAQNYGK